MKFDAVASEFSCFQVRNDSAEVALGLQARLSKLSEAFPQDNEAAASHVVRCRLGEEAHLQGSSDASQPPAILNKGVLQLACIEFPYVTELLTKTLYRCTIIAGVGELSQ